MCTTVIINCMYMYVGTFSGLGHKKKKKKFLNRRESERAANILTFPGVRAKSILLDFFFLCLRGL